MDEIGLSYRSNEGHGHRLTDIRKYVMRLFDGLQTYHQEHTQRMLRGLRIFERRTESPIGAAWVVSTCGTLYPDTTPLAKRRQ